MKKSEFLKAGASLISTDFGLEPFNQNEITREELLWELTRTIQHLLDQDFGRLMNILYRIDLSEKEVKTTLSLAEPDKIAVTLANKVLDRELQKIETRSKYRG